MDSSSSGSRADSQDSKQGTGPVSRPAPVKLTEEEKAVLLECRRNSVARGLPLGVASVVALRWFVAQGRVPTHIQRWSWFYYSAAFFGTFSMGVASYQKTCFKKIMALENSFLADQVREHFQQYKNHGYDKCFEGGSSSRETPKRSPHHSSPYRQQQEQRTYPAPGQYRHSPLRSPTSDAPSSLNADAYKKDKAALETKEEPVEQPNAFGSSVAYSPQSYDVDSGKDKLNAPANKPSGRTFDEIREENRRRQLQQNFPRSPSSSSGSSSEQRGSRVEGDWRQGKNQERQQGSIKRKNKYGDEVYEE